MEKFRVRKKIRTVTLILIVKLQLQDEKKNPTFPPCRSQVKALFECQQACKAKNEKDGKNQ